MRRGKDVDRVSQTLPCCMERNSKLRAYWRRAREATLTGKGQHLRTVTGQIHELWPEGALKRKTGTLLTVQWNKDTQAFIFLPENHIARDKWRFCNTELFSQPLEFLVVLTLLNSQKFKKMCNFVKQEWSFICNSKTVSASVCDIIYIFILMFDLFSP